MTVGPPESDQLEVCIFGPGFGECICVHLGKGAWMVVDSCREPSSDRPAALWYLSAIGVDASDAIKHVVVTHWHDDHIKGIGEVFKEATDARVTISNALKRTDLLAAVLNKDEVGAAKLGIRELRAILDLTAERRRSPKWAQSNLTIYPTPPEETLGVVALSPSDDSVSRSLLDLVSAATSRKVKLERRFVAPDSANAGSVALVIYHDAGTVLLGADLERSSNPEAGWSAVLANAKPKRPASVIKVPHHGSEGAHDDRVWAEMLEANAHAVLTPWYRGGNALPTDGDIVRLRNNSNNVYMTVPLERTTRRVKLDKSLAKMHTARVAKPSGWGYVRARRRPGDAGWTIELQGDAIKVK